MTVDITTGEIIEFDPAAAERRAERITLRLDAIADNLTAVLPMIREAIEKRDDLALGYRSPGEYVADRFGQSLAGLGFEVRRAVVGELTAAGLSSRAIAPVVDVSDRQVRRDVGHVAHLDPVILDPEPIENGEPITLRDNETVDTETGEIITRPLTAVPAPLAPVIGIDGKQYQRPTPTHKPERSGEQQNAEENSRTLASSLIFLLAFQHPNQRDTARIEWEAGSPAVSPTNRDYVTSDRMRQAAEGLALLADEWESTHE